MAKDTRPEFEGLIKRPTYNRSCAYCSRQARYDEKDGLRMLCQVCAMRFASGQVRLTGAWYVRAAAFKRVLSSREWRDSTVEPLADGSILVRHRSGATATLRPSKVCDV